MIEHVLDETTLWWLFLNGRQSLHPATLVRGLSCHERYSHNHSQCCTCNVRYMAVFSFGVLEVCDAKLNGIFPTSQVICWLSLYPMCPSHSLSPFCLKACAVIQEHVHNHPKTFQRQVWEFSHAAKLSRCHFLPLPHQFFFFFFWKKEQCLDGVPKPKNTLARQGKINTVYMAQFILGNI